MLPSFNPSYGLLYIRQSEEIEPKFNHFLKHLHGSSAPDVVGSDIEWRVTFTSEPQRKVAVLQLASEKAVCILHVSCIGQIPPVVAAFLCNKTVQKVGVGIRGDVSKMKRDFDIEVEGCVDLVDIAAQRVMKRQKTIPVGWGLAELCELVLQRTLPKPHEIRCSNWELPFLTPAQLRYAALDALAGLHLYQAMMQKGSGSDAAAEPSVAAKVVVTQPRNRVAAINRGGKEAEIEASSPA